jgi:GntR family transcriptional regulator
MPGDWVAEMGVVLDPGADVPLGVQLDWGLRAAVASGRLRPGERLPALREVAAALGVNHNTVRAAVAKLEADGVLETRHGAGTFVAAGAPADARHAELVEEVARAAHAAGLGTRALAAALYVADAPAEDDGGDAARERRTLRGEIAVLERLASRLEAQLPEPPAPPPTTSRSRGARLLDADELRTQRDAALRRLVALQGALDEDADAPPPVAPAKVPRRRRAPRPGVSPA